MKSKIEISFTNNIKKCKGVIASYDNAFLISPVNESTLGHWHINIDEFAESDTFLKISDSFDFLEKIGDLPNLIVISDYFTEDQSIQFNLYQLLNRYKLPFYIISEPPYLPFNHILVECIKDVKVGKIEHSDVYDILMEDYKTDDDMIADYLLTENNLVSEQYKLKDNNFDLTRLNKKVNL